MNINIHDVYGSGGMTVSHRRRPLVPDRCSKAAALLRNQIDQEGCNFYFYRPLPIAIIRLSACVD